MKKPKELLPGQVWLDSAHNYSDGNIVFLLLSCDVGYWAVAEFQYVNGYCGAPIRQFTDKEILNCKYVGSLEQIKKF